MNRLFFFLFLLVAVCVQSLHAQSVGVVDDVHRYAQSTAGGGFEMQSRTRFVYNGQYVSESIDETWDGQTWTPESRTTFTGDRFNLETGSFVWDASGSTWTPVDQTTHDWFFDTFTGEKIALASETYATWDGASMVTESRSVYTYDDQAVIEMDVTENWDGTAWIPVERELYIEENGEVLVVTQEFDGAAWNNTERMHWPFASRAEFQQLALELAQASVHYDGFLLILGSLPVTSTDYWTGTEWFPVLRHNATYDVSTGKRLTLTEEGFDGQGWTGVSQFNFAYDNAGQMVSMTFELMDGSGGWTAWQSDTYTWNDKSDLASVTTELFPGTEYAIQTRSDLAWRYFSVDAEPITKPVTHDLLTAWPNPFNPSASIGYRVATSGDVTVAVYDPLGRHVATLHDGFQAAGEHQVTFHADHLPSGTYIARMTSPAGQTTKFLTLLK